MKKITGLFIVLVMMFSMLTQAQTDKGSILLGVNSNFGLNMSSVKDSDWKSTTINVSPTAGYFFIDGLAAGLSLDFTTSTDKDKDLQGDDIKDKMTQLLVGPFVRYYLPIGSDMMKPFVHAEFGMGSTSMDGDSYVEKVTYSMTAYGAMAGITIFLNESVGIDFGLGYSSATMKDKDNSDNEFTTNNFGVNGGLVVFLGK